MWRINKTKLYSPYFYLDNDLYYPIAGYILFTRFFSQVSSPILQVQNEEPQKLKFATGLEANHAESGANVTSRNGA